MNVPFQHAQNQLKLFWDEQKTFLHWIFVLFFNLKFVLTRRYYSPRKIHFNLATQHNDETFFSVQESNKYQTSYNKATSNDADASWFFRCLTMCVTMLANCVFLKNVFLIWNVHSRPVHTCCPELIPIQWLRIRLAQDLCLSDLITLSR